MATTNSTPQVHPNEPRTYRAIAPRLATMNAGLSMTTRQTLNSLDAMLQRSQTTMPERTLEVPTQQYQHEPVISIGQLLSPIPDPEQQSPPSQTQQAVKTQLQREYTARILEPPGAPRIGNDLELSDSESGLGSTITGNYTSQVSQHTSLPSSLPSPPNEHQKNFSAHQLLDSRGDRQSPGGFAPGPRYHPIFGTQEPTQNVSRENMGERPASYIRLPPYRVASSPVELQHPRPMPYGIHQRWKAETLERVEQTVPDNLKFRTEKNVPR